MTKTKCNCPDCDSENCCKNGKNKDGEQTFKCKDCGRRFLDRPRKNGISQEKKDMAIKMYTEKVGFRRMGRLLNMSHVSALNIIRDYGEKLAKTPLHKGNAKVVEIDELYHWYGNKKKQSLDLDCSR